MKMIVLRFSVVAVATIIFIPLITIQHFIEPVSVCLLADICNHTWIPLCAWDNKTDDYKLFLDNCDFYEYNCDNDGNYVIRNYSDCFNPSLSTSSPCPSLDKLGTKILGYYIFKPNVQKPLIALSETTAKPTVALREKRRYTPEKTRKIKRRTTPCSPYKMDLVERAWQKSEPPSS
ncbi:hypothetical protein HF086_004268 [Spodoptera exigua]|uniref:Uncharacterized protein n=1 Tax=Spodoptera exigua TaxID=7107 RepID=A0A922MWF1_SPOEX|nr:hypothetical protein HF086_004268 [Spodoptera exigua]